MFQKMLYTTPSPQRKKETGRENKLRLFLKRSSEPLLNLQNAAEKVNIYILTLIYLKKTKQTNIQINIHTNKQKGHSEMLSYV